MTTDQETARFYKDLTEEFCFGTEEENEPEQVASRVTKFGRVEEFVAKIKAQIDEAGDEVILDVHN